MNVCPECFGSHVLKRRLIELRPSFPDDQRCTFHPNRKAVPLEEVGKVIDPGLRANYAFGEPRYDYREGDELYAVVESTTGAEEDAVISGLVDWLVENDPYWPPDGEEAFYDTDQTYVAISPDGGRQSWLWRQFREAILHRRRFFNDPAKEFLAEIFDGIQHQTNIENEPAFYRISPEEETGFYRARIVADPEAFREITRDPGRLMGTPPPALRRPGRMGAAGIPVFYGATERDTAIAELRPPVGSLIAIAQFRVHRPLHVLDLTRFIRPGKQLDIFAKNQLKRVTQWAFMQSFADEISRPIIPSDEHLEYVPAQVVAEYLTNQAMRWRGLEVTPDAIMFRSAQRHDGKNVAIMGDAADVHLDPGERPTNRSTPFGDDDDLAFLNLASALPRKDNAGLEYVAGSLDLVTVRSAVYTASTHYLSPTVAISLEDDDAGHEPRQRIKGSK